nr:hypothetical protein [Tanacetum cinerariifolium]
MDGYVMPKYENKNLFEDDSWIDIIMNDVYDTFYIDEEEEANVAKASEDMKLSIMKEKFLAMIESEKARINDYTKLVVTDGIVDYEKEKLVEDNGKGKVHDIQNRVGSVEVDLARAIKAYQVDDYDDHDIDTLDLENRIKKLEKDFGRLLKTKKAKESKKAREAKKAGDAELAKQAKKAREVELKAKDAKKAKEEESKAKKAKEAKEAMLTELKAKKAKKEKNAKEAMLAEVVQISSDEDNDEDHTSSIPQDPELPLPPTAFTAPRGYMKIAMTGYVIALFAPNAPNAPSPSATRKKKSP